MLRSGLSNNYSTQWQLPCLLSKMTHCDWWKFFLFHAVKWVLTNMIGRETITFLRKRHGKILILWQKILDMVIIKLFTATLSHIYLSHLAHLKMRNNENPSWEIITREISTVIFATSLFKMLQFLCGSLLKLKIVLHLRNYWNNSFWFRFKEYVSNN